MDEKTPLRDSISADAIKENLAHTGAAIQDNISHFVEQAKNGDTSIRGLALIAGLALVVSSVVELFRGIYLFQPTEALIAFYSLMMGSVAIAMEIDPQALPYGNNIRTWLLKYIGIVQLSTGRGAFYFVAGTLELTQDSYSATFIGFFTVLVAIAYMVVGRRATFKVKKLRQEKFPTSALKKKFEEFDERGDGALDFKEFHKLLQSLNVDITYQGAEMIYVSLDRDMQGGLSFEEFQRFWGSDPLTLIPV